MFGQEPSRKNFVYQLVDRLRNGTPFHVPSDQIITPTYAPSLARAIVELLDGGRSGTFNVVGPEILARMVFAEMVAMVFGLDLALLHARESPDLGQIARRPPRGGLRDDALRAALGHALTPPVGGLRALAPLSGTAPEGTGTAR